MPHSRSSVSALLALLAPTVLASCIETGVTQTVEGVTVEEAIYLGQTLTMQAVGAGLTAVPEADGETPTAGISEQVSFSTPCSVSGTVESSVGFAGQFDGRTGAGDFEFSLIQSHIDCLIQGYFDGTSITINGAPSSSATFVLSMQAGGSYEVNGDIQGQFSWLSGARVSSCPFQIFYGGTGAGLDQLAVFNLQGAVCGIPVVRSVTFQPA